MRAVRVGTAYVDGDPVVALTAPVLDALVADLDETVHLGRLDGTDIVYLAKRESTQQLRLFSAVGRRLPAYATALGKALLAGLGDDDELDAHLRRASRRSPTRRSPTARRSAPTWPISASADGPTTKQEAVGIACLAVALPLSDPPRTALSCSVPASRFGPERRGETLGALDASPGHDRRGTAASGLTAAAVIGNMTVHDRERCPLMWTDRRMSPRRFARDKDTGTDRGGGLVARFSRLDTVLITLRTGLIPVVPTANTATTIGIVDTLADGGVHVVELTDRGDGAVEVLAAVEAHCRDRRPDVIVGIGSVFDAGTASQYLNLGASFVVSPFLVDDVAVTCNRRMTA